MRLNRPMTGIVCLHKPKDITSFTAVAKVRRIAEEKKVGHAGTLDPLATGVLPILLGGATRFLEFLPTSPKRYTAVMRLGLTTDTLDITGTVLKECPVSCTEEDIVSLLPRFTGEIMQVPPMYSAIKKDGVRMYDLARKGIEVEREARPVTIFSLSLLKEGAPMDYDLSLEPLEENDYILDVKCSSGTYIRTLIDDLGQALGCGATMTQLVRTEVGNFTLKEAASLEELAAAKEEGRLEDYLVESGTALAHLTAVTVTDAQATRFQNGGELGLERIGFFHKKGPSVQDRFFAVKNPKGEFLGIGEVNVEKNTLDVKRVLVRR